MIVIVSVLVCREGDQWVAQALEVDMATQSLAMLDAVRDLGTMLDARDQAVSRYALFQEPVQPLPRTPEPYFAAYVAGLEVGILPLGTTRLARIRLGVSPMRSAS